MIRAARAAAAAVLFLCLAPAAASAQGQIDGRPMDVYSDGLGGLQARLDPQADNPGLFYSPFSNAGHAGLEIKQGDVYYPLNDSRTAVTPPAVTVDGRTSTMTSVYRVGPDLQVREQVTYTNGRTRFDLVYDITNVSAAPVTFRAGELADLYLGTDVGLGLFDPGPPRYVAGRQTDGNLTWGLVEQTPWTAYQESNYSLVFSNFGDQGLTNTVDPLETDNGAGAEWLVADLAPGATRTLTVRWAMRGDPLPDPVAGETVNLPGWTGSIRVRVPGSDEFVPLDTVRQVPVGTTFDTRQGRLNVEAASDLTGGTAEGWFYEGVFKVQQTGGDNPTTVLKLGGRLQCGAGASDAARISARRKRRLWGVSKGRFRTRGRFSSATVSGTKWLTKDTCAGTRTRVVRGRVRVRDFERNRTVVVRRGDSYLARAR
jgi:hypothetical protein